MEKYCMYLRKSRKDVMMANSADEEVLKRHELTLLALANSMNIEVNKIYREVGSGETISSRAVMQELLLDIEAGIWQGVFVMEVERLARGDTIDQGIVAQTFKYSATKIITPLKTYNPSDEYDEEYFEFGLFMSRREYKKINQRLDRGRIASVNEGKYIGNITPYGYSKIKLKGEKGFKLIENTEESEVLKLIFHLYAHENLSQYEVANRLNNLGYKPRHAEKWGYVTIKDMLMNPVYIGKIKWKARKQVKKTVNGVIEISRPRNKTDVIITDGLHKALIDLETWQIVQERKKLNEPKVPINREIQNPFAGLIICGKCGSIMQRRPYKEKDKETTLICRNKECDNISSKFYIVEEKILQGLKNWLQEYTVEYTQETKNIDYISISQKHIDRLNKDLAKEQKKLDKICECFEDGTYTREVYLQRSKVILEKMEKFQKELTSLEENLKEIENMQLQKDEFVPKVQNILDLYYSDISIKEKNNLLKSILKKVIYTKAERALKKNADPTNFELNLFPLLPKQGE